MASEDVSVGGIVYYGYSKESPNEWKAGMNELRKKMNSAPILTTYSDTDFIFRYSWMSDTNYVVKIEAADSTRGLAFTIFNTGLGNVWAWISGSSNVDVNTPNWGGLTSGSVWTTGSSGISTAATSVSIAKIGVLPSANSGAKTTATYLIENDSSNGPLVFPNGMRSAYTPFTTTLRGAPSSTQAKMSIFGPVHASALAGRGSPYVCMPSQTAQMIPYGSYMFSSTAVDDSTVDRRFQGVMMNSSGNAMLFMMADTGSSAYDDEE